MKLIKLAAMIISGLIMIFQFVACEQNKKMEMKAPRAKKVKKEFKEFGNARVDNYYWLNQREDPEVIAYLEAENKYTKEVLKNIHLKCVER